MVAPFVPASRPQVRTTPTAAPPDRARHVRRPRRPRRCRRGRGPRGGRGRDRDLRGARDRRRRGRPRPRRAGTPLRRRRCRRRPTPRRSSISRRSPRSSATTLLAMRLEEAGRCAATDRVGRWWPAWYGPGRDETTLADLLAHASGLAAHRALYREPARRPGLRRRDLPTCRSTRRGAAAPSTAISASCCSAWSSSASATPASSRRSAPMVRALTDAPLAYHAAGARGGRGRRRPDGSAWRQRELIVGEVNDANAWAMDGVAAARRAVRHRRPPSATSAAPCCARCAGPPSTVWRVRPPCGDSRPAAPTCRARRARSAGTRCRRRRRAGAFMSADRRRPHRLHRHVAVDRRRARRLRRAADQSRRHRRDRGRDPRAAAGRPRRRSSVPRHDRRRRAIVVAAASGPLASRSSVPCSSRRGFLMAALGPVLPELSRSHRRQPGRDGPPDDRDLRRLDRGAVRSPAGRSDRFGRRPVLIAGLLLLAATGGVIAMATSLRLVLAGRRRLRHRLRRVLAVGQRA